VDQHDEPYPGAQPAPGYQHAPWPEPSQRIRPTGFPTWAKVLIGVAAGSAVLMILMCAGLVYLGTRAPQTRALAGSQLTRRDLDTVRELGLLGPDERIKYFYSDGMLSIEQGMYFFTDEKVVVYSRDRDPRATVVPYPDIVDISGDLSDSWWVDGTIWLERADGSAVIIPISCEAGVDELYYDALVETWQQSRGRDSSPAYADSAAD
jgi:hypothetical protein